MAKVADLIAILEAQAKLGNVECYFADDGGVVIYNPEISTVWPAPEPKSSVVVVDDHASNSLRVLDLDVD